MELARVGVEVTVDDISGVQLELNCRKVAETGHDDRVVSRGLLDRTDLLSFRERGFDVVVCYSGPVSYVFDRHDDALEERLRVTRPGGQLGVLDASTHITAVVRRV
jgi:ubiquinone/menaquinone biosynthesis C-methylase UbiE